MVCEIKHFQVFQAQMLAKIMWDSMFISAEFHRLQTCNCITKVACFLLSDGVTPGIS